MTQVLIDPTTLDLMFVFIPILAIIGFFVGQWVMKKMAGPIATMAIKIRRKKLSWILHMNLAKVWKFMIVTEKLAPLEWKTDSDDIFKLDSFEKINSTTGLAPGAIFIALNAGPLNRNFEQEAMAMAAVAPLIPAPKKLFPLSLVYKKTSDKPKLPTLLQILNSIESRLHAAEKSYGLIQQVINGTISKEGALMALGYTPYQGIGFPPEAASALDAATATKGEKMQSLIAHLQAAMKITTNGVKWKFDKDANGQIINVGCEQQISADTIMALAPRAHKLDDVKTINERSAISIAAEEQPSLTNAIVMVAAGVGIFIVIIALKTVGII